MPEKYRRTTGSSIFHPKEGLCIAHVRIIWTSMCMACQNYMNKHLLGMSELYEQACVGSSELYE